MKKLGWTFFADKTKRCRVASNFCIRTIKFCLILLLLTARLSIFSQTASLKTEVSKKQILIGEQFNLKISAVYDPALAKIKWFSIPDSMSHFEVVDKGKLDTVPSGNVSALEQTLILTSFDSGKWSVPSLKIDFEPLKAGTPLTYFTDTLPVNVYYTFDTTQVLKDIKPIWEVKTMNPIWRYIIYSVIGLIVIIAAILFYRWLNRKTPVPMFNSKLTAYSEASQELMKLKQLDLNVASDTRLYHTRISEIFRRYCSRKYNVNLMTKTSSGILLELKERNVEPALLSKAAAALRGGDAVKFAKYLPPVYESENCLLDIQTLIDTIEKVTTPTEKPTS